MAELEARSLQVQAEIDELRRRLGELESDQDDVDEQLADAREVASSARQDVSTADAARGSAPRRRWPGSSPDRQDAQRAELLALVALCLRQHAQLSPICPCTCQQFGHLEPDSRKSGHTRSEVRPALRALDGVAPAGVRGVGAGPVAGRLEATVQLPGLAQVVGRGPDAGAEPGEERRARARSSRRSSAARRGRRAGRPGSGRAGRWRPRRRRPRRRRQPGHRLEHVADLEGDRLQRGADDVRAGGAAGDAR